MHDDRTPADWHAYCARRPASPPSGGGLDGLRGAARDRQSARQEAGQDHRAGDLRALAGPRRPAQAGRAQGRQRLARAEPAGRAGARTGRRFAAARVRSGRPPEGYLTPDAARELVPEVLDAWAREADEAREAARRERDRAVTFSDVAEEWKRLRRDSKPTHVADVRPFSRRSPAPASRTASARIMRAFGTRARWPRWRRPTCASSSSGWRRTRSSGRARSTSTAACCGASLSSPARPPSATGRAGASAVGSGSRWTTR